MPEAAKRFRTGWNKSAPCRQYHYLYKTAAWQKLRKRFLRDNPLCVDCFKVGIVKLAKVLDHIIPHKGSTDIFFQSGNLQSLCEYHHNKKTYQENR